MLKLLEQGFTKLNRAAALSRFSSSATSAAATASPVPEEQSAAKTDRHEHEEGSSTSSSSSGGFDGSGPDPPKRSPFRNEQEEHFAPFRFVYPEFLPDSLNIKYRNRVREKLERMDMLNRRSNLDIPEFYAGSILSVTVSDRHAPGKTTTFVGLCTERNGNGLRSSFTLRNFVDGHGLEIIYDLYNPTIINITCLRLEKRLDENLRYLRDAPPEYSTVPFDMVPELRNPDAPVPVNPIKVKLNPKPWIVKWQTWDLKGVEDITSDFEYWEEVKYDRWKYHKGHETKQYDLMKTYRGTINAEDQTEIYGEVHQQLAKLTASLRKQKKKRTFVKPQKAV